MLLDVARTIRIRAGLPTSLWPELVWTAAYILNRSPTKGLSWKTPIEVAFGKHKKPNLSSFRIISCRAYVRISENKR
jgi:hypothetical protein